MLIKQGVWFDVYAYTICIMRKRGVLLMENAKAKTINLLLYDGDLDGVISIEDSSWNSGEMYASPRESVSELVDSDACKKFGVYLLLSKNMVYVGQSCIFR